MLICGDVIRPGLAWMLTRTHRYLALVMAETRDPAGFARLRELAASGPPSSLDDARHAATRVATLMACKGGVVSDITVGDCVELADTQRRVHARGGPGFVGAVLVQGLACCIWSWPQANSPPVPSAVSRRSHTTRLCAPVTFSALHTATWEQPASAPSSCCVRPARLRRSRSSCPSSHRSPVTASGSVFALGRPATGVPAVVIAGPPRRGWPAGPG
jgi:hypothetical protein